MSFRRNHDYSKVCKLYRLDESSLATEDGKRALIAAIWRRNDPDLAEAMIADSNPKSGADLGRSLEMAVCRFHPETVNSPAKSFLDRPRVYVAVSAGLLAHPSMSRSRVCSELHRAGFKPSYKTTQVLNSTYTGTVNQVERMQRLRTPEVVAALQEQLVAKYSHDPVAMTIWEEYRDACVAAVLAQEAGDQGLESWAWSRIESLFDADHPFARRLALIRLRVADGWRVMVRLCDCANDASRRAVLRKDFGLTSKVDQDAWLEIANLFVEAKLFRHGRIN